MSAKAMSTNITIAALMHLCASPLLAQQMQTTINGSSGVRATYNVAASIEVRPGWSGLTPNFSAQLVSLDGVVLFDGTQISAAEMPAGIRNEIAAGLRGGPALTIRYGIYDGSTLIEEFQSNAASTGRKPQWTQIVGNTEGHPGATPLDRAAHKGRRMYDEGRFSIRVHEISYTGGWSDTSLRQWLKDKNTAATKGNGTSGAREADRESTTPPRSPALPDASPATQRAVRESQAAINRNGEQALEKLGEYAVEFFAERQRSKEAQQRRLDRQYAAVEERMANEIARAEQGDARAMFRVGAEFLKVNYTKLKPEARSLSIAYDWFRRAAELGNVNAMLQLGAAHELWLEDHRGAVEWYERADQAGSGVASQRLAGWYEEGSHSLPRDAGKAAYYKARAVENGDAPAMAEVGAAHLHGKGRPRDAAAARDWFLRSLLAQIDSIVPKAAIDGLHQIYSKGAAGIAKDARKAEWLKAVQKDFMLRPNRLGGCGYSWLAEYAKMEQAGTLQLKASMVAVKELENETGNAQQECARLALFNVGAAYLAGDGIAVDRQLAKEYLTKSAELGLREGMRALGYVLLTDKTQPDVEQGLHWLTKAADAGDLKAMQWLSEIHGKLGNAAEARRWGDQAKRANAGNK